jgi:hydrogenase maturation protease
VGNEWRSDDGAGLEVARRLRAAGARAVEREGEPIDLIDMWADEPQTTVIDAVSSGAEPGTIHRVDAGQTRLPAELFRGSTHALGVAEAVELARALGRLPPRLTVIGIEGAAFTAGKGLTSAVEDAVARVVRELLGES